MEVFHARNMVKLFIYTDSTRMFPKYVRVFSESTSKSDLLLSQLPEFLKLQPVPANSNYLLD